MKFLVKEIKSKTGEIHFRRWRFIETRWFSVYLHGIYKADEDKHMHDHPWDFTSLVLYGYYSEKLRASDGKSDSNVRHPWSIARRKAEQFHMIEKLWTKKVFTIVITGKRRREWGYNVDGWWIDNVSYRQRKNDGLI